MNGTAYLLGGWRWASDPANGFPETGIDGCCTTSQVWKSTDGVTWTQLADAPWEGRHMAGWAALNGQIFVVGGDINHGHYQPNVWASPDGEHWTEIADALPFGDRALHYATAFNGALWVMGGQQMPALEVPQPVPYPIAPTYYDDVWRSTDGAHWEQVGTMPHALGMICGAAVFNGELWVIGGGTYGDDIQAVPGVAYNEVWSTADGEHWTEHASPPWSGRRYHNVAVYDGTLWVMAGNGKDGSPSYFNDVWYSADGETWVELPSTPWADRHAASVFVLNGQLFLTGGTDNSQISHNDVWALAVVSRDRGQGPRGVPKNPY
jgi:N-acetylneuraminic acid mutarotase